MAETATRQPTALTRSLLGITEEKKRKAILDAVHPKHAQHSPSWQLMADAYDGSGGFLDGEYLWKFPAEIQSDFDERKAQARYHNYVATLVEIYVRYVSQGVTRTAENPEYTAWLSDVDGAGTPMAEFVKQCATDALLQGHLGALVDKTPEPAAGPAKADEKARVIATRYPATSITDWRLEGAEVVGVKLAEAAPQGSITDPIEGDDDPKQWLLWDQDEWARFDREGEPINDGRHALGVVPLAMLRPLPAQNDPFVGRMLLGNANVIRALYNRASEEDHVLRNQGFSLLTVQLPADATAEAIDKAKGEISANYGTSRAVVTVGTVGYESPDMAIPQALRENMSFLVREMYRAAHVTFQSDTRAAESAESLQIKQAELTEMLRALAASLSAFELQIAQFWFAWMSSSPQEAKAAFDKAQVTALYKPEFLLNDLEKDLKAWAEAVRFGLPPEFEKRLKKRIVRRIEPDIPHDVAKDIDAAIDKMPGQPAQVMVPGMDANALRDRAAQRMKAAGQPQAEGAAA